MNGKRARALRKQAIASGEKDWRNRYRTLKKRWTRRSAC